MHAECHQRSRLFLQLQNRVGATKENTYRPLMRRLVVILLFLAALLVVGFAFLWRSYDPGDSANSRRFRVGVVVLELSAHKQDVEQFVQSHGRLEGVGPTLRIPPNLAGYLARATVSESGTIVGFDSRNEFVVTLAPSMEGGAVRRTCTITPDVSSAVCSGK